MKFAPMGFHPSRSYCGPQVTIPYEVKLQISEVCSNCDVDGLRGDLVTNR